MDLGATTTRLDPLVERSRWTIGGCAAFTRVTRAEAARLAAPGASRTDMQGLLTRLSARFPGIVSLLVYVVDAGEIVGFAELRLEAAGQFAWHGPHVS